MATFTTYKAIGQREDLIDVITNISPVDTWFTSNTGSTKARGVYHEWQTDALAAAASNAAVEGADGSDGTITPTVRAGNYCQNIRKVFKISDDMEAVDKAGRDSEVSYQTTKFLKELARDIEYAFIVNGSASVGTTADARYMAGLVGLLTSNVNTGTGTAAGTSNMTETRLTDSLQTLWAAGGYPSNLLLSAAQKLRVDALTTNTRQIDADEKALVAAVDIYKSSFGPIKVRLHQIVNTSASSYGFMLGDMDLWKKAWLRPVKREELARTGSARKFMIEASVTLEARNEKGSLLMKNF